jgi:hypothetical protein
MAGHGDRGEQHPLRGLLSEVYLPALLSSDTDSLARRLGDRATLDDPLSGRVSRPAELSQALRSGATWLASHQAAFEKHRVVVGSDRDLTEGTLALVVNGKAVALPVAVVAEKRREREVEVRLYYSTGALGGSRSPRGPLLSSDDTVIVPPPVAAHLDALARGDHAAVLAGFEHGATLRTADGKSYGGPAGPGLGDYFGSLIASDGASGGTQMLKNARADDGSTCALEYTIVAVRGHGVAPQAGLAVYERGENGLLRAVRLYGDVV